MSRSHGILATAPLTAVLMLAIVVDPALAQTGGEGIGKGFGEMLQGWAMYLIPGAAAIVGIPMLFRAEVGPAIMVFFLALLLGSFAFMTPDIFRQLVQPVLDSIK